MTATVEAKKVGVTFGFPTTTLTSNEYSVSYFKKAFKKKLSDVIEQAQRYCVEKAVPYAILTNGAEWLVCPMLPRAGKTIDSMKGVYFGNIFSEDFAFDLFWELLSKKSILKNNLDSYLSELNHIPSDVCFILKEHYGNLIWNNINSDNNKWLDEFYQNFFSQITESNQRNMLDHCFVTDSKLDQFKGELKRVLKDTKPNFLPEDALDLEPSEGKDFVLEHHNGKVIIITGAVGCGKSTLVTKCVIEAKQAKNIYATPLIIDLINDVSKSIIDVNKIVFSYLYKNIKSNYEEEFSLDELRNTFSHEIKMLKNGAFKELIKNNHEFYIKKEAELLDKESSYEQNMVLRVFKKRVKEGKSVIVIIDNVDRASEKFQEEIYALSHLITQESNATVIITLRELTFFKNKDKGFLDVRPEDKVIHLKAPDFSKLISLRIRYIKEFINEDFRIKEWRRKYSLDEFLSAMNDYADVLRGNLQLSQEGNSILEILSSVSWHNIREFYQLVRRVHYRLGSKLSWSKSDVISALMSSIDNEEKNYIPNVFLPYQNVNQCYFLKLRILSFLNDAILQGEMSKGISLERILRFSSLYGYRKSWIVKAVEESVQGRTIECIEIPSDSDLNIYYVAQSSHSFRISPLGVSLVLDICHTPTYISLSSSDLPFHEKKPYTEIKDIYDDVMSSIQYLDDSNSSKRSVDYIVDSDIPKVMSQYLIAEYHKEKLSLNILKNQTEVNLTEKRISKFISSITNLNNNFENESIKTNVKSNQYTLPFITENTNVNNSIIMREKEIPSEFIPLTLDQAIKNSESEYIPLIFVALLIRAFMGFEASIGIDITNIINDHLVDEDNKKFTNNVSRALRSKRLASQEWLLIRADLHKKFKKFSLNNNWENYWIEIFNELPPDVKI
ncbi:P-loop NTPase fold protein [Yersinia enterocolitica]|uniref:P-loop NTPase fold protein n=1 Tax=Yersinia enterocolitica TaxID=630 RepID=UPI003F528633